MPERACARLSVFAREKEEEKGDMGSERGGRAGGDAMRCPDCFNPTGNAAVSSVTAERACVRACLCLKLCMCARPCLCVGVKNPSRVILHPYNRYICMTLTSSKIRLFLHIRINDVLHKDQWELR